MLRLASLLSPVYRLITRGTYEEEMFNKSSLKLGLDHAVLRSYNSSEGGAPPALKRDEIEDMLKKGAYHVFLENSESHQLNEDDIDVILQRDSKVITYNANGTQKTDDATDGDAAAASVGTNSFSKASFVLNGETIDLHSADFWERVGLKTAATEAELPRQRYDTEGPETGRERSHTACRRVHVARMLTRAALMCSLLLSTRKPVNYTGEQIWSLSEQTKRHRRHHDSSDDDVDDASSAFSNKNARESNESGSSSSSDDGSDVEPAARLSATKPGRKSASSTPAVVNPNGISHALADALLTALQRAGYNRWETMRAFIDRRAFSARDHDICDRLTDEALKYFSLGAIKQHLLTVPIGEGGVERGLNGELRRRGIDLNFLTSLPILRDAETIIGRYYSLRADDIQREQVRLAAMAQAVIEAQSLAATPAASSPAVPPAPTSAPASAPSAPPPPPAAIPTSVINLHTCSTCGSTNTSQSKCGGCNTVVYCSRECQLTDWKSTHKHVCGLRAKDAALQKAAIEAAGKLAKKKEAEDKEKEKQQTKDAEKEKSAAPVAAAAASSACPRGCVLPPDGADIPCEIVGETNHRNPKYLVHWRGFSRDLDHDDVTEQDRTAWKDTYPDLVREWRWKQHKEASKKADEEKAKTTKKVDAETKSPAKTSSVAETQSQTGESSASNAPVVAATATADTNAAAAQPATAESATPAAPVAPSAPTSAPAADQTEVTPATASVRTADGVADPDKNGSAKVTPVAAVTPAVVTSPHIDLTQEKASAAAAASSPAPSPAAVVSVAPAPPSQFVSGGLPMGEAYLLELITHPGYIVRGESEPRSVNELIHFIPIDPCLTTAAMVRRCRQRMMLTAVEQQHVMQYFVTHSDEKGWSAALPDETRMPRRSAMPPWWNATEESLLAGGRPVQDPTRPHDRQIVMLAYLIGYEGKNMSGIIDALMRAPWLTMHRFVGRTIIEQALIDDPNWVPPPPTTTTSPLTAGGADEATMKALSTPPKVMIDRSVAIGSPTARAVIDHLRDLTLLLAPFLDKGIPNGYRPPLTMAHVTTARERRRKLPSRPLEQIFPSTSAAQTDPPSPKKSESRTAQVDDFLSFTFQRDQIRSVLDALKRERDAVIAARRAAELAAQEERRQQEERIRIERAAIAARAQLEAEKQRERAIQLERQRVAQVERELERQRQRDREAEERLARERAAQERARQAAAARRSQEEAQRQMATDLWNRQSAPQKTPHQARSQAAATPARSRPQGDTDEVIIIDRPSQSQPRTSPSSLPVQSAASAAAAASKRLAAEIAASNLEAERENELLMQEIELQLAQKKRLAQQRAELIKKKQALIEEEAAEEEQAKVAAAEAAPKPDKRRDSSEKSRKRPADSSADSATPTSPRRVAHAASPSSAKKTKLATSSLAALKSPASVSKQTPDKDASRSPSQSQSPSKPPKTPKTPPASKKSHTAVNSAAGANSSSKKRRHADADAVEAEAEQRRNSYRALRESAAATAAAARARDEERRKQIKIESEKVHECKHCGKQSRSAYLRQVHETQLCLKRPKETAAEETTDDQERKETETTAQ